MKTFGTYTASIADDNVMQRTVIKKIIDNNYTRYKIIAETRSTAELLTVSYIQTPHVLHLRINKISDEISAILN